MLGDMTIATVQLYMYRNCVGSAIVKDFSHTGYTGLPRSACSTDYG